MITINLMNLSLLIIVGMAIWGYLPEDYKQELGTTIGISIEIIWLVIWLIIFPILGHKIMFI